MPQFPLLHNDLLAITDIETAAHGLHALTTEVVDNSFS